MALVTSTTIEVAEMHLFNSRRVLQAHGSLVKVSSWQMYVDPLLLLSKKYPKRLWDSLNLLSRLLSSHSSYHPPGIKPSSSSATSSPIYTSPHQPRRQSSSMRQGRQMGCCPNRWHSTLTDSSRCSFPTREPCRDVRCRQSTDRRARSSRRGCPRLTAARGLHLWRKRDTGWRVGKARWTSPAESSQEPRRHA